MSEKIKKLTKNQMEKAKGGILIGYTGSPHCKACDGDMAPYGAYFRCKTAGCTEQGKNKNPGEVNWY